MTLEMWQALAGYALVVASVSIICLVVGLGMLVYDRRTRRPRRPVPRLDTAQVWSDRRNPR